MTRKSLSVIRVGLKITISEKTKARIQLELRRVSLAASPSLFLMVAIGFLAGDEYSIK